MIRHFIIIGSAYSLGKRIALDYFTDDILHMDQINEDMKYIYDECGNDVSISTHFIQVEETGWDKVIESDHFFSDIELIDNKKKFVEILSKDRHLKGVDIAKYVLSKIPCTHLKLEKMVYMCYADYLCEFGGKLFDDKIYAYKLGPVIESVYEKYKKSGHMFLSVEDDTILYDEKHREMPIKSRFLAAEDGVRKLISVDKTIDKYGSFTATDLVKITHQVNTPWSMAGRGRTLYKKISDKLILEYHKNELV